MKVKEPYWAEIRNTHFAADTDLMREDGDIAASICIDAWKTNDDGEEGTVIAQVILSLHGDILVSYHDPVARVDASAQAAIAEAKEMLRNYWQEKKTAFAEDKANAPESAVDLEAARKSSEVNAIKEQFDLEYSICRHEIENYLKKQPSSYFEQRGVTLDKILSDQDLMDKLTHEHHKSVYDYGCDADWSAQNACDCEPGIV